MSVIPTIAPFLLPRILPRLRKERPAAQALPARGDQRRRGRIASPRPRRLRAAGAAVRLPARSRASTSPMTGCTSPSPRRSARPARRDPPAMIDEGRLLLLEDGHCLKEHALAACNRPELRASATMIGTSLHTLVQMVDNGLGVTMLPADGDRRRHLHDTHVVARPLKAPARQPRDRAGLAQELARAPRNSGCWRRNCAPAKAPTSPRSGCIQAAPDGRPPTGRSRSSSGTSRRAPPRSSGALSPRRTGGRSRLARPHLGHAQHFEAVRIRSERDRRRASSLPRGTIRLATSAPSVGASGRTNGPSARATSGASKPCLIHCRLRSPGGRDRWQCALRPPPQPRAG